MIMAQREYVHSANRIVFRTRMVVEDINLAALMVASALLLGGLFFMAHEPLQTEGAIFVGAALLIAGIPQVLIRRAGHQRIGSVMIDAAWPTVLLSSGASTYAVTAELPLADVQDVLLVPSDSNSTNEPAYRFYDLVMRLHEGAEILLLDNLYAHDRASLVLEQCMAVLQRARENAAVRSQDQRCVLPSWIAVQSTQLTQSIRWTAGGSVLDVFPLLGLFALFFVLVVVFRDRIPDDGLFHIAVWSVCALAGIMSVVLFFVARASRRKATLVEMDGDTLVVYREGRKDDSSTVRREPLGDIQLFGCAPYRVGSYAGLFALNTEALAAASTLSESANQDLFTSSIHEVQMLRTLLRFDLRSRSAAELMTLRSVLNHCLQAYRNEQKPMWRTEELDVFVDASTVRDADEEQGIRQRRKLRPAVLGWCGLVVIALPLLSLLWSVALLTLPSSELGGLSWLFIIVSTAHILLSIGIAAFALRLQIARVVAGLVLGVSVVYAYALVSALTQFGAIGTLLFVHNVLMLLLSVQLIRAKYKSAAAQG